MPCIKTNKIHLNLQKKGFFTKKNDHIFYSYQTISGKKTNIFTKMSHGEKEIGNGLISLMARQLKVNKNFFLQFVECAKNQQEYEIILKQNNFIK